MATNNSINAPLVTNGVVMGNSGGTAYSDVVITAGAVLAANSSGVPTSSAALTLNGVVLGGGTGVPTSSSAFSANGQLLIGNGSSAPSVATLTAGTGVSISNGAGSITISASGAEPWTNVTGTSQALAAGGRYFANNASLVTFTLPASPTAGDEYWIEGVGAGGWLIAQNALQVVHVGSVASTAGVGGSVASTNQWDSIHLVYTPTANNFSVVGGSQGNLTIV